VPWVAHSPTIRLECARVADAPEVFALLWECRHEIPLADTFDSPEHVEWVRDHCRRKRFFVVRYEGAIVGAMLLKPTELFYIAVREGFRQRGIGRRFVRYAEKRWGTLTAKAHQGNHRSIALLKSEGFRPDPVRALRSEWEAFIWTRTK